MARLEITQKNIGKNKIVALDGKIDITNISVMKEHVQTLLDTDAECVLFDFQRVEDLDSSGVAAVIETYELLKERGKGFGVFAVIPRIMKILAYMRIDRFIKIYGTEAEALEGGGGGGEKK